MPTIGLRPIAARYSLPFLPLAHGRHQAAPRLAVGHQRRGQLADPLHVERTGRAAAGVGNDAGVGIDLAHLGIPEPPQIKQPLLPPENVSAPRRVLRIVGRAADRDPVASRKFFAAMLAVAHARAVPAVDENPVHPVARHDLLLHLGHEFEVVRARARTSPTSPATPSAGAGCPRRPRRSNPGAPPARRRRWRADRCGR